MMKIPMTLKQLLKNIALDKGLAKPDAWVDSLLRHSHVAPNALRGWTLRQDPVLPFALADCDLQLPNFHAYVEMEVDSRLTRQVISFDDLDSDGFAALLRSVYYDNAGDVADFRVYCGQQNIHLHLVDATGREVDYKDPCAAVDPEELDLAQCLRHDAWSLSCAGSKAWYPNRDQLELYLSTELQSFGEDDPTHSTDDVRAVLPDGVEVSHGGEAVPFRYLVGSCPRKVLWL